MSVTAIQVMYGILALCPSTNVKCPHVEGGIAGSGSSQLRVMNRPPSPLWGTGHRAVGYRCSQEHAALLFGIIVVVVVVVGGGGGGGGVVAVVVVVLLAIDAAVVGGGW